MSRATYLEGLEFTMQKNFGHTIRVAVGCLLISAAMFGAPNQGQCSPDINVEGVYQHVITIETDERKKCFEHAEYTKLRPVTKASVSIEPAKGDSKYEDLWYANAKPVGLERTEAYSKKVDTGKLVAIRVKHKQPNNGTREVSQVEATSAADAILRVYMDVRLHHGGVATVILPADTFHNIMTGLEQHHFVQVSAEEAEKSVFGIARLILVSDQEGGESAVMRWNG